MIEQLVDAARLQTGQALDLQREPGDLVAVARQVADEYQQTTERHRIRLDPQTPELVGVWDQARLERVVANLLSNAIKYSPDGGEIAVTLAGERRDGADWAVLAVQDHGLGIPAADLPHIFERFHRGANVAGLIRGTGIGLSSAQHVVTQHGGTIGVASAEGQGSTFTVHLPLAPPAASHGAAPVTSSQPAEALPLEAAG